MRKIPSLLFFGFLAVLLVSHTSCLSDAPVSEIAERSASVSPTQAYKDYLEAIFRAEKVEELKDYVGDDMYEELLYGFGEPENGRDMDKLRFIVSGDMEFKEEKIEGDTAYLVIESKEGIGAQRGYITMKSKDGMWIVEDEEWKATILKDDDRGSRYRKEDGVRP